MKRILVLLFILLALPTFVLSAEKTYGTFPGVTFLRNYDGDTITVDIPYVPAIIGDSISIRVDSIDTPEIRGKCIKEKVMAILARNYVHTVLSDSTRIDLVNIKRGKYFRIVATVMIDQDDLANLLIKEGYAVEYDGKTKLKNWCK